MNIKFDTREIEALIPRIEKFRAGIVPSVAGVLVKQIKTLSQQQQVTYRGTPFKKLTPAYRKRKVKAGHPGIPNLTYTGKYMDRIGLRQDEDVPYVGPVAAFQPQAQGLSKKRPHLGVHPDSIRLAENGLAQMWEGIVG